MRRRSASAKAIVRLENIGLRYQRGPEILRDLNLALEPGSFHVLVGESGAGKTSLLRLIYLALRPSRGLVSLFGESATDLPRGELYPLRRRMGIVFQEFRLLDHLDVLENVCLPRRVAGEPRASYVDDAVELIEWVQMDKRMHAYPPTLSGGEKQRVAIARAVIARPEILIADEPTGNVDPAMGDQFMKLFRGLNRKDNTTVLVATHDPALNRTIGAPVLRLVDGAIVRDAGGRA